MTKKILSIVFSLVFIFALAFSISWGVINFNKVRNGMASTGVYTNEDINKSYEDGYDNALKDKAEYIATIAESRDTITSLNDKISQLNFQITNLGDNNQDYREQILILTRQKENLETQVVNLNSIKEDNEQAIRNLNRQINELNNLKDKNSIQIENLNSQIVNLQSIVEQLQKTNQLNVETINSLNNQISSLNSQITDMTLQIQNNSSNMSLLNNKIAEHEKTIAYYEQYIASLENGEQVVVTFEFAGSVYNIQVVNKGNTVSTTTPAFTDYVIFNYWTVDGQRIDLSSYEINENTRIIANVTYQYDVNFMVDGQNFDHQIVVKNGYPTLPENPIKENYEFDGWTLNGLDVVKPNILGVTQNVTYVAKFTKLHSVSFVFEDSVIETQKVRNGNFANNVIVENTDYKIFNGWLLNGMTVNVNNQRIIADTTFVASITYRYNVEFVVDGNVYNSQIVTRNEFCSLLNTPTKAGYEFDGWLLNGIIVNVNMTPIETNTTFVAQFTKLHEVNFICQGETISTQLVRDGNTAQSVSIDNNQLIFNGWTLNGEIVNVAELVINENLTLIASVENKTANLALADYKKQVNSSLTEIVFDYYTANNVYTVNGSNVINGIAPVSLDNENKIQLYKSGTKVYVLSNYTITIDSCKGMFQYYEQLTKLRLNNLDTRNVTDMSYMFHECSNLTQLDVSKLNTSKVKEMNYMFAHLEKVTSLNVSNLDTSSATNMCGMFNSCVFETIDLSNFNTGNVTSFDTMFGYNEKLKRLDLSSFNTAKATELRLMFTGCSALESVNVSSFNTSNATSMYGMFENCLSLKSIDITNFDTGNVKEINYLFYQCSSLTTIDVSNIKTGNVKDFRGMFGACANLKTIYASEWFDVSKCTNDYIMFKGSTKLVGAIAYDSSKTGKAGASYTSGYFTYKAHR